jgi:hypothetical protein
MATTNTPDQVFINRTDSGFPAYLNFATLRTNAINYLGPITSSYWTDYNIHDPGITTLEALLYAVMDLGYRVNFPIADLLTPKPGSSTNIDFFTPSQVLGGNPFTINDYRKKLMDLTEVRNAWIDVVSPAASSEAAGVSTASGVAAGVAVRGVYSVYLELEMDRSDFGTDQLWAAYRDTVVKKVKGVLQAHRNLCEDFAEPVVLLRKPIAVSADIELTDGASPADVYRQLVTDLYMFFSPAPPHYTLGQLVQMGIPLDEVFAGRPYERWPSHGFILDADLPERPTGRTPIYLSAVYHQLLDIQGVKTVRKVTLDTQAAAAGTSKGEQPMWTATLMDDVLPVLDITGSTFRWFRGGQLLAVDLSGQETALQQEVIHAGKVFYPATELDVAVPTGRWLEGLNQYYSIQNDYPQVYGIGPGGLPGTASAERQAQALQLKGYLLLFDQLLADYLAQLGSIQTLFSMGGGGASPRDGSGNAAGPGSGGTGGSTYFAGDVSSVPGLGPLLRFPAATDAGTMLVYPVATEIWEGIAGKGSIACGDLDKLSPFSFADGADRDIALAQLALSFSVQTPAVSYIPVDGKQVVYVITGLGKSFVLVSQPTYPDRATASKDASIVLYIGGTTKNYNLSVLTGDDGSLTYSFSLVQTGASYTNYVQALLESPEQYTQRRTDFLLHLMDRFAESFTDYALLSAGFLSSQEIASRQVGLMEQFLGNFPALSGNRGQAFNYTRPGWNTTNISGLERRFMAYSGINDQQRHWLCCFEVEEEDKQCQVAFTLEGKDWMVCPDSIPAGSAMPAATDLFRNLGNPESYQVIQRGDAGRWTVGVSFYGGYQAVMTADWPDEEQARTAADQLAKMRQLEPAEEDVTVSQFEYRAELLNADGKVIRVSTTPFNDESTAWEDAGKRVHHTDETKSWQFDAEKDGDIGRLIRNGSESGMSEYLDISGFTILLKHDIPHKPEHCRYTVSDGGKSYVFASTDPYPTDTQGRAAANALLFVMTQDANYKVHFDTETDRYRIAVEDKGKLLALSEEEFGEEALAAAKAATIGRVLRQRLYRLQMARVPLSWKFHFYTGLPGQAFFAFHAEKDYKTVEEARAAAADLYKADGGWEMRKTGSGYAVAKVGGAALFLLEVAPAADALAADATAGAATAAVNETELQQSVQWKNSMRMMQAGDESALNSLVRPDAESKTDGFVYRLVDKNRPKAFHPLLWKTEDEGKSVRELLIAKGRKGYQYPEICLGGDNVYFNGSDWRFLVKCRNEYFAQIGLPGHREWTMFESMVGFPSADAAQQAFQEQYFPILTLAMDRVNYGDKDPIAWSDSGRGNSVVFVPQDLQDAMNKVGLNVADELVKAAKAYPIRKKDAFVFQLINDETGEADWESAGDFANAQDAHGAFDFFRLLLNANGNYYIEYDDERCGFRLGLREVLAESVTRYSTVDAAWRAIEEFITVAQSAGGFHPEKRKDGTWGYFVAGADTHALHPCQYETEQQRDAALQQLYTAAQGFPDAAWFSGTDTVSLLDVKTGEAIAQFPSPNKGVVDETFLGLVLDLADAVWAGQFFEDEGGLYMPAGGGAVKVRPAAVVKTEETKSDAITRDQWEEQLLNYIAYFPVTRQGGIYKMEMKLPGFAALPGPWFVDKDCGCSPEKPGAAPTCFAAWAGPSAFGHAQDAWNAFLALLPLLDELSCYRSVHGRPGVYGIELYKPEEILAYNPQTYAYAEMAAQGMDRAGDCINREGLQLVEHLLLRPEKGVKTAIPVCPPATPYPNFSSQPGNDPYSFIITVFLPAWPERFRKKENRQVLERILQEETPAHILTRILWLTPADLCRWESQYKDWLRSLRPEKPCADYSADAWVKMLFTDSVQCMAEAGTAGASGMGAMATGSGAAGGATGTNAMATGTSATGDGDEWLSEINAVYCWKDRECADTAGWKFDVPDMGAPGGSIQFKPSPNPTGQTVGDAKRMVGSGVEGAVKGVVADVAKKADDVVDAVKGVADKAEDVVNKVQDATDKVHDVSNRLTEVEKIAKDVLPLVVEEIPVVGPVLVTAEKIAMRVGLWTKVLHKGVDILEGMLTRLKGLLEKGKDKTQDPKDTGQSEGGQKK